MSFPAKNPTLLGHSANSHSAKIPFLKRTSSLEIHSDSRDLPIKVRKFQFHEKTTLGKTNGKKWNWTFSIGEEKQEWEVKLDKALVGANTLEFCKDGKEVFKGKMQQDYEHKLPVRGSLNLNKAYEVKAMNGQIWYPATLLNVRPDGNYEAEVTMPPDEYGNSKKMHYPIVEVDHIRDPIKKKVMENPTSIIDLFVKKANALSPELTINGYNFTNYLWAPSPPESQGPAVINFTVNKDRTMVSADVGHEKLKCALDPTRPGYQVKSKAQSKKKLKAEWEIQIGAFATHHIVAETKSKSDKEISVFIDDQLIVAGSASDLGAREWVAEVAVQGKLQLKFKLHKTNANGVPTNETKVVTKKLVHSNTFRITVPDHTNLETATFECDEVEFSRLEECRNRHQITESLINGGMETLESTHGLSVPYVSDKDDSEDFSSEFAAFVTGGNSCLGLFACCQNPNVLEYDASTVAIVNSKEAPKEELISQLVR